LKILIINGPNLNMLGRREPDIYGSGTYAELCEYIMANTKDIDSTLEFYQSNHEGAIIDKIHQAELDSETCGIVINPGAYTHYSYAIADALKCLTKPAIEVHISDINSREEFRKNSVTGVNCKEIISGHGWNGYVEAVKKI